MATISGRVDSYDHTVPRKRAVTDNILLTSPFDRVTIDALGLKNESKFRFVNLPAREYEWLEDNYVARTDTITSSGGMASDSTTTTCLVTTPALYVPGQVILIDAEYIWVTSISSATLTIVRAYGGTQATHANSSTVTIVGTARLEGADSSNSPTTESASTTNNAQIMFREVNMSRDMKLFPNYGVADMWDYQIQKYMDELTIELDQIPYHGVRNAGSSSHASGRSAGGFEVFITSNTTAAGSVQLTRDHIDDILQSAYDAGGSPDVLLTGAFQQRVINSLYEGFITTERSEGTGGNLITMLQPPIGGMNPIEIKVDRFCKTDSVYLIDRRYAGYITIDPFFFEMLGKVGDADKGQVIGEYGFVVAYEDAHGYINGLTTS